MSVVAVSLDPDDIRNIREGLGLMQREAGELLGGAPLRQVRDWADHAIQSLCQFAPDPKLDFVQLDIGMGKGKQVGRMNQSTAQGSSSQPAQCYCGVAVPLCVVV